MSKWQQKADLAIVGAGPIGLEAASLAARAGLDFVVFEKHEIAHNIHEWGHVRLFTPLEMNHSRWSHQLLCEERPEHQLPHRTAFLSGQEYREQYLLPLARTRSLADRVLEGVEVVEIAKDKLAKKDAIGQKSRLKQDFMLRLRRDRGEQIYRSRFVIDASGVYSNPLPFGTGNMHLPNEAALESRITRRLPDLEGRDSHLRAQKLLLVGSGYSAATLLEQASKLNQAGTRVEIEWLFRNPKSEPYTLFDKDPLPYRDAIGREANRLAVSPPDWLRVHSGSVVVALSQDPSGALAVEIENTQGSSIILVEHIVAAVGFAPDRDLYKRLQVHECYASMGPIKLAGNLLGSSADCLDQLEPSVEMLRNPEPGFYILGNKSYGTLNNFLLKNGLVQVESVMKDILQVIHN